MNSTEKYFVSMLSAFLNNSDPPAPFEDTDWSELRRLAKIHSVSGIIGAEIKRNPPEHKDECCKYFYDSFLSTIQRTTRKIYAAQRLMSKLCESHIPHIMMKGFIIRKCYPVSELRTFGDVDILIKQDDRGKAKELMLSLGYEMKADKDNEMSFVAKGEYYEIHTAMLEVSLNDGADHTEYFSHAWEHIRPLDGSDYSFELLPEYHFLYLLVHLGKHICYGGAGIRLFMDIAAFLNYYDSLDFDYISAELEKLKLTDFARSISYTCYRLFNSENIFSGELSDDEFNCLADAVMSGGTFGFYSRTQALGDVRRRLKNSDSLDSARRSSIKNFLFPPYSSMRQNYRFVDGRRWLLPVGWIVRFFGVFTSKRKGAERQMTEIKEVDSLALRERRLFDKMGLK